MRIQQQPPAALALGDHASLHPKRHLPYPPPLLQALPLRDAVWIPDPEHTLIRTVSSPWGWSGFAELLIHALFPPYSPLPPQPPAPCRGLPSSAHAAHAFSVSLIGWILTYVLC